MFRMLNKSETFSLFKLDQDSHNILARNCPSIISIWLLQCQSRHGERLSPLSPQQTNATSRHTLQCQKWHKALIMTYRDSQSNWKPYTTCGIRTCHDWTPHCSVSLSSLQYFMVCISLQQKESTCAWMLSIKSYDYFMLNTSAPWMISKIFIKIYVFNCSNIIGLN